VKQLRLELDELEDTIHIQEMVKKLQVEIDSLQTKVRQTQDMEDQSTKRTVELLEKKAEDLREKIKTTQIKLETQLSQLKQKVTTTNTSDSSSSSLSSAGSNSNNNANVDAENERLMKEMSKLKDEIEREVGLRNDAESKLKQIQSSSTTTSSSSQPLPPAAVPRTQPSVPGRVIATPSTPQTRPLAARPLATRPLPTRPSGPKPTMSSADADDELYYRFVDLKLATSFGLCLCDFP